MEINNIAGDVILRNEKASISNLKMQTMGGDVVLDGSYDTKNHVKPKLDFAYDLSNISISELSNNFITVEKYAPIAKYAQGLLNSKFSMTTELMPDFTPDYSTLTGAGSFLTKAVKLTGFKPLEKLESTLNLTTLKNQEFKDVKAKFQLKEGKLFVDKFNLNLGKGIDADVEGSTSIEQELDYTVDMKIPKALIPKDAVAAAEKAIEQANKIPGFKMKGLPEKLNVKALISNTVTDPKVSSNIKEALISEAGGLKESVKAAVDEQVQNIKDTVNQVIDNAKEDLNAEKEKKKKEILAEAQKQADAVKAQAKKAGDKLRQEADKRAKDLMDEAGSNILKKKANQVLGDKLKKEADDKATKLENEADKKADNIMKAAQAKADAL